MKENTTEKSTQANTKKTYVLANEKTARYMKAAKKAYVTSEYADYTTSVVDLYTPDVTVNEWLDIPNPVSLSWDALPSAESYTLMISKNEDFSGNVLKIENITDTKYNVYNLCVDTDYFWKVSSGENESEVKVFYTDKTVRHIKADAVRNVRDLGGWNGIRQGLAYRGSEMDLIEEDGHYLELKESGRKVLHDDLGIKADFDFRITELTESPIGSDVKFINDCIIGSYTQPFNPDAASKWAGVLRTFANIDNYPIYFHCWGGADRTGTAAFLVEALCGVSEEDLAIDYELTSFANFGTEKRYRYNEPEKFFLYADMIAGLKEYDGVTLKDKAENFAISSLGLTRAEISNIRSILTGNEVVFSDTAYAAVDEKSELSLKNLNGHTVVDVTLNGKKVSCEMNGNALAVTAHETGLGVITFEDGNAIEFEAVEKVD